MPLKVIIVGAGIGGLSAAAALNQSGHDVEVFEQSAFLNEVGAAIHVPPNATRILKAWGMDLNVLRPVSCNGITVWDTQMNHLFNPLVTDSIREKIGITDDYIMTHRVDLHNALRNLAQKPYKGKTAKIFLSRRAVSADADKGEVVFEDGSRRTADLIISADGIHSRCAVAVTGQQEPRQDTGQNCFRFLVPLDKVKSNPLTNELLEKAKLLDGLTAFTSKDRRLVIYPCRSGELLNMIAIHPSNTGNLSSESAWHAAGKVEDLIDAYSEFCEPILELCRMAEDVKVWSLASRNPPRVFWKGKIALLGDAAHPTLPHQGQGGAQAFEDSMTIGTLFSEDTTPEQVAHKLALYNKIRYSHAVTTVFMSRVDNENRGSMMDALRQYVPDAQQPGNMFEYTWSSQPQKAAERELKLYRHWLAVNSQ